MSTLAKLDDALHYMLDYLSEQPAISDHDHHHSDEFFAAPMDLDRLLAASYVAWTGFVPDGSEMSRRELLDNVGYNSYFHWFEKGLQRVHSFEEPISLGNWDRVSERVRTAYAADSDFHWQTLRTHGFECLILDNYYNPGSDNGHGSLFVPTFRIDKFMYGYHSDAVAPDQFIPWERYGFSGRNLEQYVELMRHTITEQHSKGKVAALKCAEAYNRPLAFFPCDPERAAAIFGTHPSAITDEDRLLFGNYIFHACCKLAAELDVPFQVHTGLAQLSGSNPLQLEPIIAAYPDTRFVLFHSGYPWIHEVGGLAHNYTNALPNLTWTATISTAAAIQALDEYIDVARSINSITWGSDCWVAEESVGALLAWKFVIAKVLAQRLQDRRLSRKAAETLADKLIFHNARNMYLS